MKNPSNYKGTHYTTVVWKQGSLNIYRKSFNGHQIHLKSNYEDAVRCPATVKNKKILISYIYIYICPSITSEKNNKLICMLEEASKIKTNNTVICGDFNCKETFQSTLGMAVSYLGTTSCRGFEVFGVKYIIFRHYITYAINLWITHGTLM